MNNEYRCFTLFKSIKDKSLDFKILFSKVGWKSYRTFETQNEGIERFEAVFSQLFTLLFDDQPPKIEEVIHELQSLFKDSSKLDPFLSETFYLFITHYIQTLPRDTKGWKKVSNFALASEEFLNLVSKNGSSESLFVFEDSLINALENLRTHSQTINVLNTYYGVPIQFPAEILHTTTNSVVLRVRPLQETAAILQNGIYILKNNELSNDVYASITPIELNGERVLELSRFDQLENTLFHRQSVRVHPKRNSTFSIQHSSASITAKLYDISVQGVAVSTKHPYNLSLYTDATLIFPSEIITSSPNMKGKLVFKSSYEGGYKYHFRIEPTHQQEGELSKYILQRQHEIVKQLREEIV